MAFDRLLHQKPEHRQNIVSRTAGLLFHSPGSHDNIRASVSYSKSLKSCSAESLNVDTHCESNFNTKKSVSSPKSKKVVFHNKKETDGGKPRPWASETPITQERHRYPHTRLVRSKSSGECYENKLALSGIALSTVDPKRSLANAKCSLHSTTTDPFEPLESEKSRWIWGHAWQFPCLINIFASMLLHDVFAYLYKTRVILFIPHIESRILLKKSLF